MTRLEKCELLKEKGYTYNPETGQVFGSRDKEIISKDEKGYIRIRKMGIMPGSLRGHHFAWYMTYGNVDFIELDHKNRVRYDNRISNLRILSHQENTFNNNSKGYTWCNYSNKWISQIVLDGKRIYLGRYKTEDEARQAYLIAKEKYHII